MWQGSNSILVSELGTFAGAFTKKTTLPGRFAVAVSQLKCLPELNLKQYLRITPAMCICPGKCLSWDTAFANISVLHAWVLLPQILFLD